MTTQTRSAAWGTHLILTAIILVATFLPLTFINFEKIHPAEDAAMLMRYAVHLAEGYGIVWNKGEKPVDGATDFLFMVMTALLIKSGLTPEVAIRSLIFTAHLMSVLLIYLAGVLIFRVDHRIAFLASLLLVTSNGMFYVATCFGAPVFALFASAAWLCVMRMILVQSEWSWAVGYGFFSLLTGLTRPEGVILTFLMLIGLVIARGWRNALTPAIAWFAFVVGLGGLYFLWRWDYFGHPLPNPFYKKGGGTLHLDGLRNSVQNFIGLNRLFIVLWLIAMLIAPTSRVLYGMITPILGFVFAFILLSPEMNTQARFQYVTLPLMIIASFHAYQVIRDSVQITLKSSSVGVRLGLGALLLLPLLILYRGYGDIRRSLPGHDSRYDVAVALSAYAHKGYYLAVTEAGLLPFYSGWKSIDTWGLNDSWIAHNGLITEEYLDKYRPAVIMFHAHYTPLTPVRRVNRWDEMVAILHNYARSRNYTLAAVYTDTPYSNSAHWYYVRSDLEETEALIRCIREVNYVYWRSGKRAINLRDYVKEQTSEETSANKARR
jgi:arabinofuranosyltransferase